VSPRRICVIGNSHLAAVKLGWEAVETGETEAVFLSATGPRLRDLAVVDGVLTAPEPVATLMRELTGVSAVAVAEVDAFVLVGLRFSVNRAVQVFTTHRTWAANDPAAGGGAHLVSAGCFSGAVRNLLETSMALILAARIRSASRAPLFIIPQPAASERVLQMTTAETAVWRDIVRHRRTSELNETYLASCAAVERARDVRVLQQPRTTIVNDMFTMSTFDSPPFDQSGKPVRGGTIDPFHTNGAYGALVVAELLAQLPATAVT